MVVTGLRAELITRVSETFDEGGLLEMGVPEKNDRISDNIRARDDNSVRLQKALHIHAGRLQDYVRSRLPLDLCSFIDPGDVLQEVFFDAFQRIAEFEMRSVEQEYSWLLKIARHRLIDLVRARRSAKRSGIRGIADAPDGVDVRVLLEQLAVYSRTPSQSAMSHELARTMQNSMQRIEPDHREAIQLRYIDGLSAKQSAERMGRTQAAVFMLCQRGLKALRVHLVEAGALTAC